MLNNGWSLDKLGQPSQNREATQNGRDAASGYAEYSKIISSLANSASNSNNNNQNNWFVSPQVIKCTTENRIYGFAPDPRDCSKFYICEQSEESGGESKGFLMQCVAGLWWDQGRRMCASPMEVSCNPFNIINTHSVSG